MTLRIDGGGNLFPDRQSAGSVKKANSQKTNFDMLDALKKFKPEDLKAGVDDLLAPLRESEFTDKNGNLKPGVSPQVALDKDGSLKPGWSVDSNGNPHYQRSLRGPVDLLKQELPKSTMRDEDPGFHQECPKTKELDPGYYQEFPAVQVDGEYKMVPTYELKDGKLVQTGETEKFVAFKSIAV